MRIPYVFDGGHGCLPVLRPAPAVVPGSSFGGSSEGESGVGERAASWVHSWAPVKVLTDQKMTDRQK